MVAQQRCVSQWMEPGVSDDPGTTSMPPPAVRDEAEPAVDLPTEAERPADAAVLVVARGPQAGEQIALRRSPVQLGRSADCDVVLEDVTVSRHHARITKEDDQYVVVDSGSLNGTYVNRSPVEGPTTLGDGDEVRIGIFRLIFHP